MIELEPVIIKGHTSKSYLVTSLSEVYNLEFDSKELCFDFETGSGDPKKDSFNVRKNCFAAGVSVQAKDGFYYIPTGHSEPYAGYNLSEEKVKEWWKSIIPSFSTLVAHNIKYDITISDYLWGTDIIHSDTMLKDTVVLAKLVTSDLWRYDLDYLGKHFFNIGKAKSKLAPYLKGNKDYSRIPADVMAEYANWDTGLLSFLYNFLEDRLPDSCKALWETEQKVTKALLQIEFNGMQIDGRLLKIAYEQLMDCMNTTYTKMQEISGEHFRPHISKDLERVLVGKYNLPVVEWTDKNAPSFSKNAIASYKSLPNAPVEFLNLLEKYKHAYTDVNFFVHPYAEKSVSGRLHSNYNQLVRTGRMSCSDPNSQQLNKFAKLLILADPDCELISIDYSQIEFRFIVHYIQNKKALAAYEEDPWTDYHTWVAELCGIPRKPAKNINFMLAFGGGKKKTLAMLSSSPDLISRFDNVKGDETYFRRMCAKLAEDVFEGYHDALPELKRVSNKVASVCRARGYIFNIYGRRRHLPRKAAHRAFNTLNQSSAADLIKERLVAVQDYLWKYCPEISIRAVVHDDIVFNVPKDCKNKVEHLDNIVDIMESPSVSLRVPVKCSASKFGMSWGACTDSELNPNRGYRDE